MRYCIALSLLVWLSACSGVSPDEQTRIIQAVAVACNIDGAVVPLAQPVVATLGQGGAKAASVDNMLVHPAVVAACQKFGGTPAAVTPANPPTQAGTTSPAL
jgi:hypothetical protein